MKKEIKSAVIYFRLKPSTKRELEKLAEKEMRSVSQMLEVIVIKYLRQQKEANKS